MQLVLTVKASLAGRTTRLSRGSSVRSGWAPHWWYDPPVGPTDESPSSGAAATVSLRSSCRPPMRIERPAYVRSNHSRSR